MLASLCRKGRQLTQDPVLRRWLVGAALGRYGRPSGYQAHRPPYLTPLLPLCGGQPDENVTKRFQSLDGPDPAAPITLALPGQDFTIAPGEAQTLFEAPFEDIETRLAAHRFAWVPLAGKDVDLNWLEAFWKAWIAGYSEPDDSWAWHPYTAAERVINIIGFAEQFGLPGDRGETLDVLARHGPAIAGRLEYFGDRQTGNHLSNNGRGLYLLGLALGIEPYVEMGRIILLEEAPALFAQSGVLREGSTHYHLLLTRNYASVWLAARRDNRPEAAEFQAITEAALAAIPALCLPGGMPLIGDISPDCPPSFFGAFLPGGGKGGWLDVLEGDQSDAFLQLRDSTNPADSARLWEDGWIRKMSGDWSCLCHVPPTGWFPMPGHAHQDLGSFELHHGDLPIFVDPGRGAYGNEGEAAFYTSAAAHNGLLIDGAEPYPVNRPYYDDDFRRKVAASPGTSASENRLSVSHRGFERLGRVGEAARSFAFEDRHLTVSDRLVGTGRHRVTRRFHTVLSVEKHGDDLILGDGNRRYRLSADAPITIAQGKRWTAYGVSQPAHVLEIDNVIALPATIHVRLDAL